MTRHLISTSTADSGVRRFVYPVCAVLLVVFLGLAGGSSRGDALSQVVIRVVSILVITVLLTTRASAPSSAASPRLAYGFLGAIAVAIAVQLIPLPPELWTALPGRAPYGELTELLAIAPAWRPLSLTPDLTWNALFALLPALAALMVCARAGQSSVRWAVVAIAVLAIVSGLFALVQLAVGAAHQLSFYAITNVGSATGLFANRNHNGLLLAIGVPVVAYLFFDQPAAHPSGRGWLGLAILALLTMLIPATGSRAALVTGTVGLFAAAVLGRRAIGHLLKRYRPTTLALVLFGAIAVLGGLLAFALRIGRLQALERIFAGGIESDPRVRTVGTIIAMIGQYWPTGSGYGAFASLYRRFEPFEMLQFTYLNQAHNDFVQILIEGGLLGGLLIAAYLIWWTVRAYGVLFTDAKGGPRERGLLGAAITFIVMIASIPDYPMRTPLISAIFAVASFLMVVSQHAQREVGKRAA